MSPRERFHKGESEESDGSGPRRNRREDLQGRQKSPVARKEAMLLF